MLVVTLVLSNAQYQPQLCSGELIRIPSTLDQGGALGA